MKPHGRLLYMLATGFLASLISVLLIAGFKSANAQSAEHVFVKESSEGMDGDVDILVYRYGNCRLFVITNGMGSPKPSVSCWTPR